MAFTSLLWNKYVFLVEILICIITIIFVIIDVLKSNNYIKSTISKAIESIDSHYDDILVKFNVPAVLIGKNMEIVMVNDLFYEKVSNQNNIFGTSIKEFVKDKDLSKVLVGDVVDISYNNFRYTSFSVSANDSNIICFVEDTYYKEISAEYVKSRPAVAIIMFDNKEEIERESVDGDDSRITSMVENEIKKWVATTSGFLKKINGNRYILMLENRHVSHFINEKFTILEKIRKIKIDDRRNATISIGIGRNGNTFKECEYWARKALDMALGRGGDQVVIKQGESYSFFGGISRGIESRSKVRTRVIASTLVEQIQSSSLVLIMGHKYSDLDCIGASIGLWSAIVRGQGKLARIVIDKELSLAKPLINSFESIEDNEMFINEKKALDMVTSNTLLIIVDTHSPNFLESKELYDRCNKVIVIDHHRMMVNHIDDAVVFYHETYASSASEMVVELIQYMGQNSLNRLEAESLLAGIMLDTKNFVLKTGVRTFEAAAYLRKKGADTVEVKRLFSNTIDTYKVKYQLVSGAEIFNSCAIASSDEDADIRLAAAQAADELLGIQGVEASFVIYSYDGVINISARSLGGINVQLIMESMGGGGHQTMAGAQLEGSTMEHARERLVEIITSLKIENN